MINELGVLIIFLFAVSMIFLTFMMYYLRTSKTNSLYKESELKDILKKTESSINDLKERIYNINADKYSKEDIDFIIKEFKKDDSLKVFMKNIKEDILNNTDNNAKEQIAHIQEEFIRLENSNNERFLISHLNNQLETFKRMANVNLFWGATITLIVFIFLTYTMIEVIDKSEANINSENFIFLFISIFVPRFTFAFLCNYLVCFF